MLETLHPDEVEDMLYLHHIGQLACIDRDRPYIVPITYVYDGGSVYGHTAPGRKIGALRMRPAVAFCIQDHPEPNVWRSVVAEGVYEEVTADPERQDLLAALDLASPHVHMDAEEIVFRLRLTSRSGRLLRTPHPG